MENIGRIESFMGKAIPDIDLNGMMEESIKCVEPQAIADKIRNMPADERDRLTIDKIHYNTWGNISAVMLTSGDVISTETAIALADQNAIKGYCAGSNREHQRTLISNPGDEERHLHDHQIF